MVWGNGENLGSPPPGMMASLVSTTPILAELAAQYSNAQLRQCKNLRQ